MANAKKRWIVQGPLATAAHKSRVFKRKRHARECAAELDEMLGTTAHRIVKGFCTSNGWSRA